MAGSYELWLTDDAGVRLAPLSNIISLEASRAEGQIGACNLRAALSFNPDMLLPDRQIQIWRQPQGGNLGLWRVYFLRKWTFSTRGSEQIIEMGGPDVMDLLRRRIVAAYAGSSQAGKTDYADDMMKEVVSQAILDTASPTPSAGTRAWANLSIAPDLSLGPTITKSFSWDKLLTSSGAGVLPAIQEAAREAGTEVFFDIIPNAVTASSISFIFQTFIGQPGQDVSSRIAFDLARGNMRDPELRYDYSEEENYIYAGGQGEGAARVIQQVYDSARYGVSIWARCEGFADARNQSTGDGVTEAGRSALEAGRPKIQFSAIPVDTAGTRFGIDWDFGDLVQARYLNRQFYSIIRAVTISVDDEGNEEIRARLDYESAV